MTNTKRLMIQGTASSVGKSLIVSALCRIFHRDGYRVAPFKAQNMSNNSFVTSGGLEMGRAQVVQAYASGLEPDVRMNPVLLKPSSGGGAQVVIMGKPAFTMNAPQWQSTRDRLRDTILDCYESLSADYNLIIIEGAGSPAEINLKKNDIVNMGMAAMADAPVIIVGDIDRGGVFASLVGTMQLLDPDECARVKGFIINKFRGDVDQLAPGLDELEKITGVPVLGVVPWIDHAIDDEDGVTARFERTNVTPGNIDVCIIRVPHVSNFTDFIPLEAVPGVTVRWCDTLDAVGKPDLLILPGTKATMADLQTLKQAGISDAVVAYARSGGNLLGICGGFQMLGSVLRDPDHVESATVEESGLGLLDMVTVFEAEKRTVQSTITLRGRAMNIFSALDGVPVHGYEIRMGRSEFGESCVPFTSVVQTSGEENIIGVADADGRIAGTYCHGLFDSGTVVTSVIDTLRKAKGLAPLQNDVVDRRIVLERDLNRLAEVCYSSLDIQKIKDIAGLAA